MTKVEFLQRMDTALKKLPAGERQDILADYREHFEIAMSEGEAEEEISAALGSPQQLAKEQLASYHMERAESTASAGNILRAAFAVISLGFFNLVFVLAILIVLAALIFSGWIIGLAFVLSPLLVIVDTVVHVGTFEFFPLFASLGLCGLGLLILIGMKAVSKAAAKGFVRYLKLNVRIVKGGNDRG